MKIAVYYNLNFGGAKRVVYEQVALLSKRHAIDIYKINEEEDQLDPIQFASAVYRFSQPNLLTFSFLRRLFYDLGTYIQLKKVHEKIAQAIDAQGYDLVLVHPDKLTQAPFLLRFLKTPSVYYCQEPLRIAYEYSLRLKKNVSLQKRLYEEVNRLIRKKIDRSNARAATYLLASCLHVRERMIEAYDIYPDINYPGVDISVFRPLGKRKKRQVVFVGGKTVPTDGYDLIDKALQLLPRSDRPLVKHITWKKNSNERLSDRELVDIYNESIVVLCLSRLEAFGLVPLEAMACGIPVIATNVSGHRETLVDGKTGYLVEFDPKQVADKLVHLLKNPQDAKRIGSAGVEHVRRYWTWERSITSLEQHLEKYITSV